MSDMSTAAGSATLTDGEFQTFVRFASEEAGLSIPASKKSLVQSRVSKRLRQLGIASCREYLAQLETTASEKRELISILTTNISSFYRESHHFEYLRDHAFPDIRSNLERGGRARFWSAGCSSGEEPYTLAMEILKAIPNAAAQDLLVLASDIDPKILQQATRAVYPMSALDDVAPEDKTRFFMPLDGDPNKVAAKDELKKLVRFRELNLHAPWPMTGTFDVIFCRNVVIYFDEHRQRELWPRFRDILSPGGLLILGHSERIQPLDGSGFTSEGVTIYRRS